MYNKNISYFHKFLSRSIKYTAPFLYILANKTIKKMCNKGSALFLDAKTACKLLILSLQAVNYYLVLTKVPLRSSSNASESSS